VIFHQPKLIKGLLAVALLALMLLIAVTQAPFSVGIKPAQAAPMAQETTPEPEVNKSIRNETCLACHSEPNLSMSLENGQLLSLFVPPQVYEESIHGRLGYACVQCHTTVGDYPHPAFSAEDRRDVTLKLYPACQQCHSSLYELAQDSVHQTMLDAGNRNAAVCTDCHTAHATRQLTDTETGGLLPETRIWIPHTCAQCHYAIYQKYTTSVHGSALLGEGNPDVPTCIDCHGVHNIEDPTTAAFRLSSPELCAKCHTDPTIMDKYGLSTQVLSTYVADFHGTTVTIFERENPNQETNKPVCFDCHGVHDIKSVNDPVEGLRIRENLLARCRVCHPDASANFPDAWLSHYIPSLESNPVVFTVDIFYKLFIPTVLGGMAVLVVLDIGSIFSKRFGAAKKQSKADLSEKKSAHEVETTAKEAPQASEDEESGEDGQHG